MADLSSIKGELGEVLKKISKHSVNSISLASSVPQIKRLPFGLFEMDTLTNGGMPYNRITTVWGIEGSGKGNLVFNAIRMSQMMNPRKVQVWVDAEGTFDPTWAIRFGINLDFLIVYKPPTGEDACDAIEAFTKADEVDMVVVDSLPALVPVRELERSMDTAEVGGNALLIRRLTNKLVTALTGEEARGHEVLVVYINQVRFKIGQMHGNPESMPCGIAPRFFSSLIIKLYAKDVFDKAINAEKASFRETNVTLTKSKVFVNGRTTVYKIALIATDDIPVGRCDSWNAVNNYLKNFGLIEKVKEGYELFVQGKGKKPVVYERLMDVKAAYQIDPAFANLLHNLIATEMSGEATYIEDKKDTAPKNPLKLTMGKANG